MRKHSNATGMGALLAACFTVASALSTNHREGTFPHHGAVDTGHWTLNISSPWTTIATNPDLGNLTGDKQQPVDFAVWRAEDGRWQLWSCIRGTKIGGDTRLFYRWQSPAGGGGPRLLCQPQSGVLLA